MLRFTLIAALLGLLAGCNEIVSVTALPTTVPGFGTSAITATVMVKINGVITPIVPKPVTFTVDQAGSVGPTATTGPGTGVATQTFTAANVTQNTVATITATCGSGKSTCAVTVTPFPVTSPFTNATGPVPGGEAVSVLVTSAPSTKGLKYTFVVTPSNSGRVIKFMTLKFQPPVKALSSSIGAASAQPTAPSQIWNVTNPSEVAGSITLTTDADYSDGGAISWDIGGLDTATTVWHATVTTLGPK